MRLGERLLQFLELRAGERRSNAALFPFFRADRGVVTVLVHLVGQTRQMHAWKIRQIYTYV